ncbi:MAG TPA: PhzF family phenazine biosynthesis protein [Opitutaceae bacterium]|nr:PhzF family phenazine biosynthesis protein [Opitutaceae bacterium]
MILDYYHVDAFADRVFTGNPAGVVPLKRWLPAAVLQSLATENGHPETAFFVPRGNGFHLRWFTPKVEVELCGHATLAAAHVLWTHLAHAEDPIRFETLSGPVSVSRESGRLMLDFPARPPQPSDNPQALAEALGAKPFQVWKAGNYLAVFRREEELRALAPDFAKFGPLDAFGVIATAPGKSVDFVSRFFAPKAGINEDPVTGSAHCTLAPYWSKRLGKPRLRAEQLSARGGRLWCEVDGDRVKIAGHAVTYLRGQIEV